VQRVLETPLVAPPDTVMRYSDLGLLTLGWVVEQVTGTSLDRAIGELVTGPLGLRSTRFVPPPELKPRVAPTEDESNVGRGMVWGEVHDENAWSLGGVAGHAGIFGPADELAVLAQMYLDGGTFRGERFVQEDTVSEATRNQIGRLGERGLGWELDETYYMGRLAAPNVYGHTGFTGTSVVIDPDRELIVIVLTNRVHPTRNGPNMNPTRQAVANAALAVTSGSSSAPSRSVAPGVEVLLADRSDLLKGRRIGLVTNHTGLDVAGHSTIDRLYGQPDWRLTALFSPEHGIRGEVAAGENVGTSVDPQTGLPVFSLYGQTTRPTAAMLGNVDTLVFDLQDVGARTYTYISTLLEVLRAAAEHHVPVIVLDRPNPINGVDIDGPVLDPRFTSFVGAGPIAMRYGLTIGELGRLFNVELRVGADLIVVPVDRWRRTDWYDQTGLAWVNPSPNIRSLGAALVYPGTVLFEATTVSEGRGTEQPFEWIGAPWIDGAAWAERLNRFELPGVRFHARAATPTESKFAGQLCHGVLIEVVDRRVVRPVQIGVAMLLTADQLHYTDAFDRLAGTDQLRHALTSGASLVDITAGWQADLQRFNGVRQRYLLY
jgi:uncharacterized protein YbbC (DUF1343 family)